MKIKDFLSNISNNTLTERLQLLDQSIKELHENNFYVVSDMADIDIYDNQITLASFKNKVDYIKQDFNNKEKYDGFNPHGDKQDILEMCAIGICAYNHFETFYTSKDFINYLIDNLDMYLENGNIPSIMKEYYINVFLRGKVDYLSNFLNKYESSGNNKGNRKVLTKKTAIGEAFMEKDAYARILLLPAVLVLVILIFIVVYYIYFRR